MFRRTSGDALRGKIKKQLGSESNKANIIMTLNLIEHRHYQSNGVFFGGGDEV